MISSSLRVAKTGTQLAEVASQINNLGSKVNTASLMRLTPKLSNHAIKRMVERGVTPKMVFSVFKNGQRFYDPLNKSINYILPNSFGSGKSLLIGVNPLTGEVATVVRSSKNLIKKRMFLID